MQMIKRKIGEIFFANGAELFAGAFVGAVILAAWYLIPADMSFRPLLISFLAVLATPVGTFLGRKISSWR